MVRFIGKDEYGLPYYVVRYQPGCFDELPWEDEECDCIVWMQTELTDEQLREVALAVARINNDWVEIAGPQCEDLHDAIDRAAVVIGRQQAVGEGIPLTSWHDNIQTIQAFVELACPHPARNDHALLIVVGSEDECERVLDLLRNRLH